MQAQAQAISFICEEGFGNETEDSANADILATIEEISPAQIVDSSFWKMQEINNDETLAEVLTETGRCFVFNSLSLNEMYTEEYENVYLFH